MSMRSMAVSVLVLACTLVPVPGASAAGCYEYTSLEQELAARTNGTRESAGLPRLVLDPELSRVAARHSYWMARLGRLYHTRGLDWKVTNWITLGENAGAGGSITSVHSAFLASAAHRANILGRGFTYFGVAVARGHDRLWLTVIFESKANPGTTLPMPSCG